MRDNHDPDLRALVVWVPMLGGEEKEVHEATGVVPDARATHFWDGHGATVHAFAPALGLKCSAWDVYLIYGPDARWHGERPPAPRFWMHQLSRLSCPRARAALRLKPKTFAARLAEVAPPAPAR